MENYSVLMSVYKNEKPQYFDLSIRSMLDQTVRTNDFVIVCDGPLTNELDTILESYAAEYPNIFNIVRLPENVGIGMAAREGLKHCKNDLVAKMDADDIAVSFRCEKQLEKFAENPELTVIGGFIEEFSQDVAVPFAIRSVPTTNEEIRRFARRRQPFNNMTVMYRKNAVEQVGSYRDFRRCEDYDLYVRLLYAGYYTENLPQVLVSARVDNGAHARRASKGTLEGVIRSRWNAYCIGYSTLLDFLICVVGELVIAVSPVWLQQFIYSNFLRKECDS